MQFVDNSDDYEEVKLYEYTMTFNEITEEDADFLLYHFDDYSWDMGLAISEAFADFSEGQLVVKFTSAKFFNHKPSEEWTNDDLEENILTRLVGKDQFFSNIYYEWVDRPEKDILFVCTKGDYKAVLSKYSDLIEV